MAQKLYTEEQVRLAYIQGYNRGQNNDSDNLENYMSFVKSTVIELPSDEDIAKMVGRGGCDYEGAKWMKDKILKSK